MKILFIGDIVGRPGRHAVQAILPHLKKEHTIDVVLANGENLAGGLGLTYNKYQEMRDAGIDYFTTGNHVWAKKEFWPYLDAPNVRVLRPANYAPSQPGRGWVVFEHGGQRIQVINLLGQAFMKDETANYFDSVDAILADTQADIRIVDFHAEATSEKAILGYYLDGKVTAFLGTHTHVPTADERILPKGTAFQTDVGMTGPLNSSLGAKLDPYYQTARTGTPAKYEVASGPVVFNSTLMEINEDNQVISIERMQKIYEPV